MDHYGNDFQSQNFQLLGEDNNKFPSSLRLFSLPKLEFDDHLQIHLRFDGLVEHEALLGIQDPVKNYWIEDFSPGSTSLELSPGGAESCSISMQKNVWSEATSSESVEMLLKSVREDDMMDKRTDAIYSESNGLENASDPITSSYSKDDSFQLEEDKAKGGDPLPLPGHREEDLSRLNRGACAVLPDVQDMSETFNDNETQSRIFVLDEVSMGEQVNNTMEVVSKQCSLSESFNPLFESFPIMEKVLDNSHSETSNAGNLNAEFVKMNESSDHAASTNSMAEDSKDTFVMQIDLISSSTTSDANDIDEPPTKKFGMHLSESHGEEVSHLKPQNLGDGHHNIGLVVRTSEGHMVENSHDSPESSSSLEPKPESSAFLMEGCKEQGNSEEGFLDNVAYHIKVQSGINGTGHSLRTAYDESDRITENQINLNGHSVEVSNMDSIQSTNADSLKQSKEVSSDAGGESSSLQGYLMHDENVMFVKTTDASGDCEGRQLEEPAVPAEDKTGGCDNPDEKKEFVELCTLSNTNFGMEEEDKKEDNSLGIHSAELTSQDQQPLGIEKSSGNKVLENDEVISCDSLNRPTEIVQEVDRSPASCVGHSQMVQISPSRDASELDTCDVTIELGDKSFDGHISPLLTKKMSSISPASPDNMNPHTDTQNLQDNSPLSQTESVLSGHVEGEPARVSPQVESGDVVKFKESTLQSASLNRNSSEPCVSENGGCGPGNLPHKGSGENNPTSSDSKESNTSDRRESTDQCKRFSDMQSCELRQDGEGCPTASGLRKANPKVLKETPGQIHPPAEIANKRTRRDKSKTVSRSLPEKLTVPKRKPIKESVLANQADKGNGNQRSTPANKVGSMNRSAQVEIHQHSCSVGGSIKASCASSLQASNLPDSIHLPFTDKQQVQLRAQIFVYGSLIQGTPPEEACMISAFGNTNGEQSAWAGVLQIALERFHSQKSPTTNCVTVSHSHSGATVHEQISRSSSLQRKNRGISLSQSSKDVPPVIFSSPTSLTSPFWCVSNPCDILQPNVSKGPVFNSNEIFSSFHTSHSSHGKQYAGNSIPSLSQASPLPLPLPLLTTSQTSILDGGANFSKLSLTETFQLAPVINSSGLCSSNLQLKMPGSFMTAGVPLTLSASTTVQAEPMKETESSSPEKHATSNQKTGEKKGMLSHVPTQLLPHSQPCTGLEPTTADIGHLPNMPTATPFVPLPSPHLHTMGSQVNEKKAIVLEEPCSKTIQGKLQAEGVAAVAAAAVRHGEAIWSQLSAQKSSGLVSEKEMKLAYAAVAAAAAYSVAKAAAAAAKLASDAALQAKLMADEAMASGTGNCTQNSQTVNIGAGTCLAGVTPTLILKGRDEISNSSSLIAAAKEAARRRLEAASAVAKHAENLDTIVKAAELTAVAVSQAGAIIALGDPLPFILSDLIEAGPEGCEKVQHSIAVARKEKQMDLDFANDLNKSLAHLCTTSNEKHIQKVTVDGGKSSLAVELEQSIERQNVPFDTSTPEYVKNQTVANVKQNSIQEGSLVEVLSNENGLRRVWYSATVLNLKDGKAHVCYNEHLSAGSDKLKEWIPLEVECDKPPRMRMAHPITAVKYEGTRKRRRAAIANCVWAIGDQVDAWVHNGWCEGIVAEKSKEDETKLTVHFPAGGDKSVINVWHLRPSLVWKDGQWIEWSRPRQSIFHQFEGDTPQDKRQKHIRTERQNDTEVMKHSASFQIDDSLSQTVGEESNSDMLRVKRIGLQKEGSRVIFGIPKPGKKRKFMEVSKHYNKEKSDDVTEGNGSIKSTQYYPQPSRGWKNTKADPKGRRGGERKPSVVRSAKTQSIRTRSAAEGNGSFLSLLSTSNSAGTVATASHQESSDKNLLDAASISNNFEAEENRSESHQCLLSGTASANKKINSAFASDTGTKGKVESSLEKANNEENRLYLVDHPGEALNDSVEPRRTSRRILPTSRLLEGLQSTMAATKIPSFPHGKGARTSHRIGATLRGNVNG